jgi:tetratricopeptide (TPR) repeat protein
LQASSDEFFVQNELGEGEEAEFEFPEATEDDESLVMLTPEQAKKLVKKRAEKAQKEKELFQKLLEEGKTALEVRDYEKAREYFTQANELNSDDLEVNVGYMRAYSEDFTALDDMEMLRDVYAQCYESAGEPFAKQIRETYGDVLKAALEKLTAQEEEAYEKFAFGQEERRAGYAARVNAWGTKLLWTGIPCLTLGVAAVIFLSLIDAIQGELFVILAAVCGGLAVALLVSVLIFSSRYLNARRLQTENENLSSTKDGRAVQNMRDAIAFLKDCLK